MESLQLVEANIATETMLDPLTEFTLFPKLPPELRQKIFNHSVPTVPKGFRMLKVSGNVIAPYEYASKTKHERLRTDVKCSIDFTLEDNEDSASVNNLTLSRTNRESRAIFLQQNPHSLRTLVGKHGLGLIRYGRKDIIYIANFDVLEYSVALLPYFDFSRFEVTRIPNLAIPISRLLDCAVKGTTTQPILSAKKKVYAQSSFRLLTRLQGSRSLGLVCVIDKPQSQPVFNFVANRRLFVKAALNSTEVVRDLLKASRHWAVEDLPDIQMLALNGERAQE